MKRNKRIYFLFIWFASLSLILIFRLYYIQIFKGSFLKQEAFMQKTGAITETARGDILDRNGKSLTGSYAADFAIISPNWLSVSEKQLLLEKNILTSLDDNKINTIKITMENQEILNELNDKTPGVFIYNKSVRYGPKALATHTVGFQGQTGIEKAFDSLLESDVKRYIITDGLSQPIAGFAFNDKKSWPWGIKLTLDKDIQKIIENVMDKRIETGAVVVMEANSGEILAMASRPNYKQFELKEYLNQENAPLVNRAIESYTPGSIFKIVILSAALEENLTDLDEVFYCSGFEKVGGNIFRCSSFEDGGHEEITLKDAMAFSCNSVFIQLGLRLGKDNILKYARLYGLGEKTFVGLPEEKEGNIPEKKEIFYQDLGNISIGQGAIGISPIQAAQMILILVNDGVFKNPILIKEIIDQDRKEQPIGLSKQKTGRILSEETCRKVKETLEAATNYGTGKRANPQNKNQIGGKTGTAEVENNNSHAWFVGYYPVKTPELVISVLVERGGSGSIKAAPVFKEIVEKITAIDNN
ncbi:MAG: penicillin-binding transpeptidase domain-containing protein [Tepidanaerobacteraceae bacterium]|nr:penicillin-binding transpeptidase domain-containing protein [Tepidanaerobacteraceae bacterium]